MLSLDDDVAELVDALKAVDQLRSVSVDAAELTSLPGAYVRATGITLPGTLRGYTVATQVYLVVADQGVMRAYKALGDLLNAVRPVLDSFGGADPELQLVGLQIPGSGSTTPLPSLVVQLPLDVEETE